MQKSRKLENIGHGRKALLAGLAITILGTLALGSPDGRHVLQ